MITSRWRKILGDLSNNKLRTFLVILAISIGIFGISVVANSYSILLREMDKNYMSTTPASATLWTSQLDASTLEEIDNFPYIQDTEQRKKIVGRVQVGENEWKDIWLFVIHDFNEIQLDTFTSEDGNSVPGKGEILLERKALSIANSKLGQVLNISIPDGDITPLNLVGTVHAPGLAPAWMEGFAYGYISEETYKLLGETFVFTELKILVSSDAMNIEHIKKSAYMLKAYLEQKDINVMRIDIPEPGKHPHYNQMATLLFLMEIFGLLSLILSGVLVANMITAIMEQQIRQIGIMKAIGASSQQIMYLYQGMVISFSIVSLLLSIPAGIYVGRGYAGVAANLLNFNIYSNDIPLYIFALEAAVGLLIPMIMAAHPILKGSKVTVREALNDYGIHQDKYTGKNSITKIKLLSIFPRPLLISIRNTFRRKGRLIFTMLVMAVGGTGFIVAMNIYASMYTTVDTKMNSMLYDIQVTFEHPQPDETFENAIAQIPGVATVESWSGASAQRVYADGTYGKNFNNIAPPSTTNLMTPPPLYDGRWLESRDSNALVINQRLLSDESDIKVGDEITLKINEMEINFMIVGISKELIGPPAAYVNLEYLSKVLNMDNMYKYAIVATNEHSSEAQSTVAQLIEKKMSNQGIKINSLFKMADYRKAIEDHLLIIATFLIVMSILVVIVGGLGLATTISINTLERTREIGIMRAIGAAPSSLTGIIVTEGIIIGIISWVVSMALSWPLSQFVSYNFGMIFFEAPLEFAVSILGFGIWFAVVILFAAMASFYPSWKAIQMSVRDALSYE